VNRILLVAAAIISAGVIASGVASTARAASVGAVSIVPTDVTPGAITSYTVSFVATNSLPAGGTITVDWAGDGISSGNIQQLLPTTVTFTAGTTNCTGTAKVVFGNTVITLADGAAACTTVSGGMIRFTVTNVRNPFQVTQSAGGVQTSADNTATIPDANPTAWAGANLTSTGAITPGAGPVITTVFAQGSLVSFNAYLPTAGTVVSFTTTNGVFLSNSTTTITCRDGDPTCDLDGFRNGIVSVFLKATGVVGPATVTASNAEFTRSLTITFGTQDGSLSLTPSTTVIASDSSTSTTITATVLNGNGLNAANGTQVTFTTTLGTLSAASGGSLGGTVSTTLTSGTPGIAVITATAGSTTATVQITVTGVPTSLTLALANANVAPTGNIRGTVTVRDGGGNPVPGLLVSYQVVGLACVTSLSTQFGANAVAGTTTGTYTIAYSGGASALGTVCTMTATFGSLSATASYTVRSAIDASAIVTVIPPSTCTVSTNCNVIALVTDLSSGQVEDGVAVTASVSAGSLAATTVNLRGGVAAFTFVAPASPLETVTVVVLVAGGPLTAATASFSVSAGAPPPPPPPTGAVQQAIPATSAGLFCFTYSGPAAAVANFAAFFNGAIDGVNVQASDGSYTSWFRALPSAATITSIASEARLCVGGTPGTTVFA